VIGQLLPVEADQRVFSSKFLVTRWIYKISVLQTIVDPISLRGCRSIVLLAGSRDCRKKVPL
jgi:hypothetical protein